jgi:hypothetical protein
VEKLKGETTILKNEELYYKNSNSISAAKII